MIALAKVLRPHGLDGSCVVALLTSDAERLREVETFRIGRHDDDAGDQPYRVTTVRVVGRQVIVHLEGIENRDAAESLRGMLLLVPDSEAAALPPGQYYAHQIVGCTVVDERGASLGMVVEVMDMPAQDIYVVTSAERTWWLPAAQAIIAGIDIAAKRITVRAMDGLLETGPSH